MEHLQTPRIVIAGAGPQSGSSLVSLALALELKRRAVAISCAIVGPNLGLATMLRRLVGRAVRVFDDRLLAPGQTLISTYQASVGAELLLVDGGNAGLYDGYQPGALRGSPAEYAASLHTPVVLVVDPNGFGASLSYLYRGYRQAAQEFSVAGLILNNFASGNGLLSEEGYDQALNAAGERSSFGVLPACECQLPRLPVSQAKNLVSLSRQFLIDLGALAAAHLDVNEVIAAAAQATAIRITEYQHRPLPRRTRIAVSDDSCFNLLFQDNLELLRYYGAEIVPFSPLADDQLPRGIGGVYLTGCCLEEYASDLAENRSMQESIAAFADSGGVVYSEGAGSSYLCRNYKTADGRVFTGVGLTAGTAVSLAGQFSYVEAVSLEESILGRAGLIIKGVSSGDWRMASEERTVKALRFSGQGSAAQHEGYSPSAQVLSTFAFFHFGSNPEMAKNIVDAAQVVCPLPAST